MPLNFPQIYYEEGRGPIYDYNIEYQVDGESRTG